MIRHILATGAAVLVLAAGPAGPASADPKGKPPGHAKGKKVPPGQAKKYHGGKRGVGRGHGRGRGAIVRSYYNGGYWPCRRLPPGIRKNLRRGKPIPPGLRKRCRLPVRLARRFPDYRPGYAYYGIGDSLYLVRPANSLIISISVSVF